ncbi:MAG: glycosyltransferase family 4 protein [Defluviitaleaceae bacterium]|nr:glycosyltransferase family 4 protein [Defluviitaleaceae bacterium]MCL2239737.1 glycosyltransferase family 4 protein [Defluviitaleaceae bacterium]
MNILYLINFAGKSGTEKYVDIVASHAHALGHGVYFMYNAGGPLVARMAAISRDVARLDMKSPLDIIAARRLARYCKAHGIDIIHTQFARENYIAVLAKALFRARVRIVHTCHISAVNGFAWRCLHRLLSGGNGRVIAVCNVVRNLLIANGYPAGKIQVINNGVAYRPRLDKPERAEGAFHFVSLARFSQDKGILFLLESAKRLMENDAEAGGGFRLTIAGDGPLLEEARAFIQANGLSHAIALPGFCQDAAALLRDGDCYINSAQSGEAHSFAVLEAMEAGLPIIATDIGGNPDIVNAQTGCGLLVPYGNHEAMARAMAYIRDNPDQAAPMAHNARHAVKTLFTIENTLDATCRVYEEIGGASCTSS